MRGYTTCAITRSTYGKIRQCKEIMQKELIVTNFAMGCVIERLTNLYLKERELHEETDDNTRQH